MKIGHYAPRLWASGGVATYIRRLGESQIAQGHNVLYLSRDSQEAEKRADVHRVRSASDLFAHADRHGLDVLHLHDYVALPSNRQVPVVRTMHNHRASCPSGSRYLARTGQPCDRIPSIPGCLYGHCVDRCGSVRPTRAIQSVNRFHSEVEAASEVFTLPVSRFLRDRMVEAGCPPERLQVIRSPAPEIQKRVPPIDRTSTPRFLFMGRVAPQKGLEWLLRSFARLSIDVHLDVAGTGDLLTSSRSLVDDLGLSNRVTFHGWVPADQISSLISASRAVVFPSVWHEPAGLVSLEAAAHGRALIASRVGGIPEYATEANAIFVSPNDTAGLTEAMQELASNPDRAAQLGQNGRTLARSRFAMNDFLDQLDAVYRSLIHETMRNTCVTIS